MNQAINQKNRHRMAQKHSDQSYAIDSRQQTIAHIAEIDRAVTMLEMISPICGWKQRQEKKSYADSKCIKWSDRPFYQSLHMDLTSYQTLKQLIIENMTLLHESESAYFLSKQAHKLISVIDGYKRFSEGIQIKEQVSFDAQDQKSSMKQVSRGKRNAKQARKLSQKPALIQEDEAQECLIEEEDQSENQIQIEIQRQQTQQEMEQNNINMSNVAIPNVNNQKNNDTKPLPKQTNVKILSNNANNNKVIKLYTGNNAKSNPSGDNDNVLQTVNRGKGSSNDNNSNSDSLSNLSQIIRPEYQKTQVSIQGESSLEQSRTSENMSGDHIIVEVQPDIAANNRSETTKKIIPLLKKGKSSVNYNALICATKIASRVDKGFVSEDTDANSRLSALSNNQKVSIKLQNPQRSLSPKLQKAKVQHNKKKVNIKRSSNNNIPSNEVQKQAKPHQERNQLNMNHQSRMEIQIRQLEEQFMNRNTAKGEQANSIQKQVNTSILEPSLTQSQQQSCHSQWPKPIPRQNKTLKLIKKSSHQRQASNDSLDYQHKAQQRQEHKQHTHLPLTNGSLPSIRKQQMNMQKHSIVLEEEPWECDQLELEEELKVLDQKIQGRKSMLTANSDHVLIPSQRVYHKDISQPTKRTINTHKRANTSSSNLHNYNQHLFDENHELFDRNEQEQPQQPKVVRLSLTALANNAGRKSREVQRNSQRSREQKGLEDKREQRGSQLKKDPSCSQLKKEPSCKSILLYEEAEKRGISPSKSVKSLKGNNKSVSPIKQFNQTLNPHSKPTNILLHTPKQTATNKVQIYQKINEINYKNDNSRTLSDVADSEKVSRNDVYSNSSQLLSLKIADEGRKKVNIRRAMEMNDENRNMLNYTQHANMSSMRKDVSMYSNCQSYFMPYERHQEDERYHYYEQKLALQRQYVPHAYHYQPQVPTKKWSTCQSEQGKGGKKNKMVLLSDQLGD